MDTTPESLGVEGDCNRGERVDGWGELCDGGGGDVKVDLLLTVGGVLSCGDSGDPFRSGVLKRESPNSALPMGGGVSKLSSAIRVGLGEGVRSRALSSPVRRDRSEPAGEEPA